MNSLTRIIPETVSEAVSLVDAFPSRINRVLEGASFYVDGNRLLKDAKNFRGAVDKLRNGFTNLRKLMDGMSEDDIDNMINTMLRMEHRMSEIRLEAREAILSAEHKIADKASTRKTLLRRILSATDQMYLAFLQFMRDARWEVMAIRAEREPVIQGDVLTSSEDVRRFFAGLEATNAS